MESERHVKSSLHQRSRGQCGGSLFLLIHSSSMGWWVLVFRFFVIFKYLLENMNDGVTANLSSISLKIDMNLAIDLLIKLA